MRQLTPQVYDSDSDEFAIAKDPDLTKYFDLMRRVQEIQGNYEKDEDLNFNESRQVAMMVSWISHANVGSHTESLNFDVLTVPTWPDLPNIGTRSDPVASFLVLNYLVSDEYQTYLSRIGRPSSLAELTIHEQYGEENFGDKKYNVKSGWTLTPANPLKLTPETMGFMGYIEEKMNEFFESGDDTPTFLRKMEDEYTTLVKERQDQE
ncbi:hypothetical protein [Bacillus sp. FSL K6-3431]|uniref:hypothetical protein n=1 Tax=Bacillus sp. FSL K6-3431 TaxID=2921500 RepID=UPI0030FBA71D